MRSKVSILPAVLAVWAAACDNAPGRILVPNGGTVAIASYVDVNADGHFTANLDVPTTGLRALLYLAGASQPTASCVSLPHMPHARSTGNFSPATSGRYTSTASRTPSRTGTIRSLAVRAVEWCDPSRPGRTAGLAEIHVDPACRRQGLATHLIGEAFRVLAGQGVAFVDAQAAQSQMPVVELYRRLGFQQVDQGIVYRKDVDG